MPPRKGRVRTQAVPARVARLIKWGCWKGEANCLERISELMDMPAPNWLPQEGWGPSG